MSKHTPGPWIIESGGARIIQTTAFVISSNDGLGPVAFSTTVNARLIAAAPDLLEALEFINLASCYANEENTDVHKDALLLISKKARAAIEKSKVSK